VVLLPELERRTHPPALGLGPLAPVIARLMPGQEERNADHLLEAGAAIRCNNLPALAWKIDRLLDDPGRLDAMRANARRLARPDAARDIAAALVEAGPGGA
jgi:processive 1,2-diacylglycerol beta-glucosyltransferase